MLMVQYCMSAANNYKTADWLEYFSVFVRWESTFYKYPDQSHVIYLPAPSALDFGFNDLSIILILYNIRVWVWVRVLLRLWIFKIIDTDHVDTDHVILIGLHCFDTDNVGLIQITFPWSAVMCSTTTHPVTWYTSRLYNFSVTTPSDLMLPSDLTSHKHCLVTVTFDLWLLTFDLGRSPLTLALMFDYRYFNHLKDLWY